MSSQFDALAVRRAVAVIKQNVGRIDQTICGDAARSLLDLFVEGETVCAAGKALAARRVEDSNAFVKTGHRDASSYLAEKSGVSKSEASKELDTARKLESLPNAASKFQSGEISKTQASLIANGA